MIKLIAALLLVPCLAAAQEPLGPDSGTVPKPKVKTIQMDAEDISVPTLPAAEWKTLPAQDKLGALVFDDGTKIALAPDDVLWLARMIHAETEGSAWGADASAMAWSLAQRSYWRGRKESPAALAPLYSQPLNKRWTRDGDKCKDDPRKDEVEKKGEYNPCAKHRLDLREKLITLPWDKISDLARVNAVLFAIGRLPNTVPGSVGWLAPVVWHPGGEEGAKELVRFHGNIYYVSTKTRTIGGSKRKTEGWTGSEVVVEGPGGKRSTVDRKYLPE